MPSNERVGSGTCKKISRSAISSGVCNLIKVLILRSHVIYRQNQVEAEEQSDIAESFDIEAVPLVIILQVCAFIRLQKPYRLNFPVKP